MVIRRPVVTILEMHSNRPCRLTYALSPSVSGSNNLGVQYVYRFFLCTMELALSVYN